MAKSDLRGGTINQIISGIKSIKMNAWERILNNQVKSLRLQEGNLIFRSFSLLNLSNSIVAIIPSILIVVIFILNKKVNQEELEVSVIYQLVTLFNAIIEPMKMLVLVLMAKADMESALKRMKRFFKLKLHPGLKDDTEL